MFHVLLASVVLGLAAMAGDEKQAQAKSIHDFTLKDIDGKDVALSRYKGKVLLIVNVASKCGLTNSNYAGLKEIYGRYKDQGFEVLAFPANNFGNQEPGENAEIKQFCSAKGAEFPVFAKVSVKGEDQCPLYQYLTKHPESQIAGEVQWNFQKYLVGRDGQVIAKFSPKVSPPDKQLTDAIEKALAETGK